MMVVGSVGVFMTITSYSFTSTGGETSSGTAFAFFDPNWYLDLKELKAPSSTDPDQFAAEAYNNRIIRAAYGNLRDRSDGAELALGFAGMLFGVFVLCLLGGLILNLIAKERSQEKNSGILFLIAGAASLGAMLLAWDGLSAVTTDGDLFPLPVGVLLVFFAGYRAYTGEKLQQRRRLPPQHQAKEQFCVHCGASLLPPGKFCTKCGKDQI